MPDSNDQPSLPTPPTDSTIKSVIKDLWAKYSIFFVIVGILMLVAKFGNLAMDFLAFKSKRAVDDAQKTDQKLKAEENAANKQANDLIKQAEDLPKTEKPVDENWNKK